MGWPKKMLVGLLCRANRKYGLKIERGLQLQKKIIWAQKIEKINNESASNSPKMFVAHEETACYVGFISPEFIL